MRGGDRGPNLFVNTLKHKEAQKAEDQNPHHQRYVPPKSRNIPYIRAKTFISATEPPDLRRVSEEFLKGFRRGLWRVFEGSSYLSAEGPFKTPSKRLQEPFENLSEGVEIDDALTSESLVVPYSLPRDAIRL